MQFFIIGWFVEQSTNWQNKGRQVHFHPLIEQQVTARLRIFVCFAVYHKTSGMVNQVYWHDVCSILTTSY
ncbi:MAG: hypothetical protein EAZ91_10635 [Cytophagales bacterium]|nr:MAG: hypothetical protein EAZ91_10635 [Cytophagales bacterium]